MSILSDNLLVLRKRESLTQDALAQKLGLSRERLKTYEYGRSEPPLDVLKSIAAYYHISIDVLISVDLRRADISELLKLADNRVLLPIVTDKAGRNLIEVVPLKAKAGYLTGYSDPEYIEELPVLSLPIIKGNKLRAFPIEGDSMPPFQTGSYILASYVENKESIKDGKTYILVTRDEGIVYKRLFLEPENPGQLLVKSDNPVYDPYQIEVSDLVELWEYAASLNTFEYEPEHLDPNSVSRMFSEIKADIREIRSKL